MRDQHDGEIMLDCEAPKQAYELASLGMCVLVASVHIRQGVEDD